MLDVREFAEGSLSVRAVGENELVIEGVVESTQSDVSEGCRSSKSASRKFQQRFMFPGQFFFCEWKRVEHFSVHINLFASDVSEKGFEHFSVHIKIEANNLSCTKIYFSARHAWNCRKVLPFLKRLLHTSKKLDCFTLKI